VASPGADSYLGGSPPITTINNPLNIISNEKTGPIGALLRTTSPLNTIPRAASSSLRFTFPTDVQNNSSLLIDALALQQSIYDAKNKGVSIIPQQQNQTTVWPQQNEFGTWPPGRPTSQKPITFADSEKVVHTISNKKHFNMTFFFLYRRFNNQALTFRHRLLPVIH
jgi:hypothetical protein